MKVRSPVQIVSSVLLSLLSLHSFPATAVAGGHGGNGGDVIVCGKSKAIFLDVKEGADRGLKLDLPAGTLRQKVEQTLDRAVGKESHNVELVKKTAIAIVSDLEFFAKGGAAGGGSVLRFTDEELADIPDSKEVSIPTGCEIKQLVIQIQDKLVTKFDKQFVMNKKYWSMLPLDEQAAVVMHEAWYHQIIADTGSDDIDSRFARFLNELTFSDEIEKAAYKEYEELRMMGFETGVTLRRRIDFRGVIMELVSAGEASRYRFANPDFRFHFGGDKLFRTDLTRTVYVANGRIKEARFTPSFSEDFILTNTNQWVRIQPIPEAGDDDLGHYAYSADSNTLSDIVAYLQLSRDGLMVDEYVYCTDPSINATTGVLTCGSLSPKHPFIHRN